jgi:hypothetical protein
MRLLLTTLDLWKNRGNGCNVFFIESENLIPRNRDHQRLAKIAVEGKIFTCGFSKKYLSCVAQLMVRRGSVYGAAWLSSWCGVAQLMVRHGSVLWCGVAQLMVRRGSVMVRRGSVIWCGVASRWCGVAQLVARRLAVRQARVRLSARHHRECFPTERTSDEEMEGERPRRLETDKCIVRMGLNECM